MKESNNRIAYFDYLKLISIILVIYVHMAWISESKFSNLTMLLTIVAVPLFFMVNGALLFSKPLDIKKHYIKVVKLILTVIVWKLIIFVVWNALGRVDKGELRFGNILTYLLFERRIGDTPVEHLWFMYSLIRIYIFYPLIRLMMDKDKKYLKYILIIAFVFSFGTEFMNWGYRTINNSLELGKYSVINATYLPIPDLQYLTYFILGYLIHSKLYEKSFEKKKIYYLIPIVGFIVGVGVLLFVRYKQTGSALDGKYVRIINDYSKISDLLMASSMF